MLKAGSDATRLYYCGILLVSTYLLDPLRTQATDGCLIIASFGKVSPESPVGRDSPSLPSAPGRDPPEDSLRGLNLVLRHGYATPHLSYTMILVPQMPSRHGVLLLKYVI